MNETENKIQQYRLDAISLSITIYYNENNANQRESDADKFIEFADKLFQYIMNGKVEENG